MGHFKKISTKNSNKTPIHQAQKTLPAGWKNAFGSDTPAQKILGRCPNLLSVCCFGEHLKLLGCFDHNVPKHQNIEDFRPFIALENKFCLKISHIKTDPFGGFWLASYSMA